MKSVYKLKQHYSTLHKFFNEEGLGTKDVSYMLNVTEPTCRNYLKNPTILNARHFRLICSELEVDENFLLDIINEQLENENKRH